MSNIDINGHVSITNGNVSNTYKNHIVGNGLKSIMSCVISGYLQNTSSSYNVTMSWRLPSYDWTMYVGGDQITTTTIETNELTSVIDILPSSKQIFTKDGSTDGVWEVMYRSVWNRGMINGTIGEVGLYTKCLTNTTLRWAVSSYYQSSAVVANPSRALTSRLSVADGDFVAHEIDPDYPLIIDWTIRFAFAGSGQS